MGVGRVELKINPIYFKNILNCMHNRYKITIKVKIEIEKNKVN
jgi:hypothetical protein